MPRIPRHALPTMSALLLLVLAPALALAQRPPAPRRPSHPPHPQPAVTIRGQVFIGGYFYDPIFGPYPWWPRVSYPQWYYPIYDLHAEIRLHVEPEEAEDAAVYVDGFYAGVVDDFNGVFQALPLTPGGHRIVLYLEGYRTVRHNLYLQPGSTFSLRERMQRLAPGETSQRPEIVPAVPPPPAGTYRSPVTPPRVPAPPSPAATSAAVGFGALDLFVQPEDAAVTIDGQPWVSSDAGHFMVQVPAGTHRVEVRRGGYRHFIADVVVREAETSPLNVSLVPGT
jgi:hypothetical protein